MKHDITESIVFGAIVVLAVLGAAFMAFGSFDFVVVGQCEKYGYWQSGQTRVVCVIERPDTKPRLTL